MFKFSKQILSTALLTGLLSLWVTPALSQTSNVSNLAGLTANRYAERQELVRKYGINSTINVGWYVGAVQSVEFRDVLSRFLPLSNYLSTSLGGLVVLVTDKSDEEIASDALRGDVDIIYTSALQGTKLIDKGWKPIVGRTENIKGVVLTRVNSKIDKMEDLRGKKVMANQVATVTQYVKYSLHKSKMLDNISFIEQFVGQTDLLTYLKDGVADAVVVRDTLAQQLMRENPGKYQITFKGEVAPGHMLFLSPRISNREEQLREAFLKLSPTSAENKEILSGLDGYREDDLKPFKEVTVNDLNLSKEVISIVPNLKIKTSF